MTFNHTYVGSIPTGPRENNVNFFINNEYFQLLFMKN